MSICISSVVLSLFFSVPYSGVSLGLILLLFVREEDLAREIDLSGAAALGGLGLCIMDEDKTVDEGQTNQYDIHNFRSHVQHAVI